MTLTGKAKDKREKSINVAGAEGINAMIFMYLCSNSI